MIGHDLILILITPTSLAVVGYLFRDVLRTWIERSIEQKFDTKLEKLRSELRIKEQAFSSDLLSKEAEISALRAGALSGLSNRQIELDKRRLIAVERIWSAVIRLRKGLMLAHMMSRIKLDVAVAETKSDPQAREPFNRLLEAFKFDISELGLPLIEQPFVSAQAWKIFDAYQNIIVGPYLTLQALTVGVANEDGGKTLVKSVRELLPHFSKLLDDFGPAALPDLLGTLEGLLMAELKQQLGGSESDEHVISQSLSIVKSIEVSRELQRAQVPNSLLQEAPKVT